MIPLRLFHCCMDVNTGLHNLGLCFLHVILAMTQDFGLYGLIQGIALFWRLLRQTRDTEDLL